MGTKAPSFSVSDLAPNEWDGMMFVARSVI